MVTERSEGTGRFAAAPAVLLLCLLLAVPRARAGHLEVEVFRGGFATVNSYIFSNGQSMVVMDVQRKTDEARKLADFIRSKGLPLTHILISHGHTDHFTGMDLFHKEFPAAKIVVANEEIKRDIKNYAIYMDSGGETGGEPALEPALRPKSAANPDGFDYENIIHVLPSPTLTLVGGGTLELDTDYLPAEAPHMTTVYSKDLNALFLADFGYDKVHLWMGDDITRPRIANWKKDLQQIRARYSSRHPVIYPGHGEPADMALLDTLIRYLDDFTRVTAHAGTRDQAMTEMQALYPDYKEANFFLKYSVQNHVK